MVSRDRERTWRVGKANFVRMAHYAQRKLLFLTERVIYLKGNPEIDAKCNNIADNNKGLAPREERRPLALLKRSFCCILYQF